MTPPTFGTILLALIVTGLVWLAFALFGDDQ